MELQCFPWGRSSPPWVGPPLRGGGPLLRWHVVHWCCTTQAHGCCVLADAVTLSFQSLQRYCPQQTNGIAVLSVGEVLPSVGWPSSPWGRPSSPVAYCSLVLYNPSTWLLCSGGCSDIIIPISSEILPTANKWNCSAFRGGGPPLRGLALLSVGEALFSGGILFTGVVQPKHMAAVFWRMQ